MTTNGLCADWRLYIRRPSVQVVQTQYHSDMKTISKYCWKIGCLMTSISRHVSSVVAEDDAFEALGW